MDLDALLRHYLGHDDPEDANPASIPTALGRIAIDFGVERDAGRRFALWSLMAMLGDAPDPRTAFKDRETQAAAERFAALLAQAEATHDGTG